MAAVIHWGPPGSYKSSSVLWFKVLPALREGRVVVTNIEGLYPLDYIEDQLGEKFPDTAKLVRISSLKAKYRDLWRRWYHWMPIGAMVVIDEAQDVYPKTGWKEDELDYKPVEFYSEYLPDWFVTYVCETHIAFKPDLDESSSDDTGEVQFDKDGLIIYPQTFNESYKRHRKYNWDILLATPDINDLHKQIRGACELAVSYSNKDTFWRKRKPRLFEHDPNRKPKVNKDDIVTTHRVPLDVHLLYKSTQTGLVTKSGQSVGALANTKVKLVLFVLFPLSFGWFCYEIYTVATRPDPSSVQKHQVVSKGAVHGSNSANPAITVDSHGVPIPAARPAASVLPDAFVMPYEAVKIFWTSESCKLEKRIRDCYQVFELVIAGVHSQVNSEELLTMGYGVQAVGYCHSVLMDKGRHLKDVYCQPTALPVETASVKLQPGVLNSVTGKGDASADSSDNQTAQQ